MSESKVFTVATPDWRIEFLNLIGKLLYLSRRTNVLVLHDAGDEDESTNVG
jgi:hypothetical protein